MREFFKRHLRGFILLKTTHVYNIVLASEEKVVIKEAVDYWNSKTCMTLLYQPGVNRGDYIRFFPGRGCYSMVGKQGGMQSISLGNGCVQVNQICQFEIY